MAVIKLTNLGGLLPSVLPRALPDNGAQKAENILARTVEFRPLKNDLTAVADTGGTNPTNPKTIHRLSRKPDGTFNTDATAVNSWKIHANEVNYVKAQINDNTTERTYYTDADGAFPPRVLSASERNAAGNHFAGIDKPLGVPAPASAPTGVVNRNYLYTAAARSAELAKARDDAVEIIRRSAVIEWLGATFGFEADGVTKRKHPGNVTPGYMDQAGLGSLENPDNAKVYRVMQVEALNSTKVLNSFASSALTEQAKPRLDSAGNVVYDGVFDARLLSVYATATGPYGSTTWWGSSPFTSTVAICTPFVVYGRTYNIPQNPVASQATLGKYAMANDMVKIKMPGTSTTPDTPLFTLEQCNKFLQLLVDTCGAGSPRVKPLIDQLDNEANKFHVTLDAGLCTSIEQVVLEQEALQVLSDAIGAEYEKIFAEIPAMLEQFFYTEGIDARVPPGVPRILEDRFYIATYVTGWGEESAPSPPSAMVEVDQAETVTGSPPNPPSGYGITKFRYYRTNTGSTASAFQFVGEVEFLGASLTSGELTPVEDTKKSTELGEVCPTLTWAMPPSNLSGLTGMPNGIMAGFFDNTLCFCESYVPYAWPVEYQITTEYPIVGLGVVGQTLVVLTHGNPYLVSGSDAASMSALKLDSPQSCVSRRSIISAEGGVVFASPDGLCSASNGGIQVITQNHFTREDWQTLNPTSIVGAFHEGTYYFTYDNGTQGCYAIHLETGKLTTVDAQGSAFYVDLLTDTLYIAKDRTIKALFQGAGHRTGTWKSKLSVMPKHTGFAWLTIESDFSSPITVNWYGDGALAYSATVTSRAPVRLPAGVYLEHEIEVITSARWNALTMAGSAEELQSV